MIYAHIIRNGNIYGLAFRDMGFNNILNDIEFSPFIETTIVEASGDRKRLLKKIHEYAVYRQIHIEGLPVEEMLDAVKSNSPEERAEILKMRVHTLEEFLGYYLNFSARLRYSNGLLNQENAQTREILKATCELNAKLNDILACEAAVMGEMLSDEVVNELSKKVAEMTQMIQ